MNRARCTLILTLLLAVSPLAAESEREREPGIQGWGLRVGVADGPDQVVVGAHVDLGELARQVRFRPNAELGIGDDHTTLFLTAPVFYRFQIKRAFTPYAGGGPAAGVVDRDKARGDDTDFEIGLRAIGGVEWRLRGGNDFFVELALGIGDVHDAEILAGWIF